MIRLLILVLIAFPVKIFSQTCGNSSWTTIGYNAQRTSATNGCIYALENLWSYQAIPPTGKIFYNTGSGSILATNEGIYYRYAHYDTTGHTTGTKDKGAIDKISLSGTKVWSYPALGKDHDEHNWPALMNGFLYLNADFLNKVNATTGVPSSSIGPDTWGELLPDSLNQRLYGTNVNHIDGGGLWVGATTPTLQFIWYRNANGSFPSLSDYRRGVLALDNNILFYAPHYSISPWGTTSQYSSGLYAFVASGTNPLNGTLLWFKPMTPTGPISVANNKVFSLEGTLFVCRNQSNGDIVWSKTINGTLPKNQPPVIVNNLAIIATSTGVYAYNVSDGTTAWTRNITGIPVLIPSLSNEITVMAAATGSNTLVVTSDNGIYVLLLSNGQTLWSGSPSLIPVGNRACNPVIVGERLYVNLPYGNAQQRFPTRLICLKSNLSPVPIEYVDLKIQEQLTSIKLQWDVSEIPNGEFQILLNGVVIKTVVADKITTFENLPKTDGYYQIRYNNVFSNIVNYKNKYKKLSVQPNPTNNTFSIIGSLFNPRVVVFDTEGKKIVEYRRLNNLTIPVGHFICVVYDNDVIVDYIRVTRNVN